MPSWQAGSSCSAARLRSVDARSAVSPCNQLTGRCSLAAPWRSRFDDESGDPPVTQGEAEVEIDLSSREVALEIVHDVEMVVVALLVAPIMSMVLGEFAGRA